MTQRGSHTWDLYIHYYTCPACGFIIESRSDYEYREKKYQKDLECERCHHHFTVTKPKHSRFGPLLGPPEHAEMEWPD